ncbi:hypothetical protein [Tenacibaculum caenipelagi]|uniref:Uncharacterized protein n=1 Tax=Tenacibaculum caenipelagi TaxID=1325435 RepID=A0A4R6TFX8_9FLAO|nr:hypothetical protein [Tenacibaculum caenipelagi]TDQ27616.1 hypothetical protein DFQ07_1467 [Tenacibaculum caenipelagi]
MWLLKLFTLKDLRYVLLIALLGFGAYLFHQNKLLKKENQRMVSNYQTALKLDSLKVALFKVNKEEEIKELLNQNKDLNSLVEKAEIKTKRIEALYYQQQMYVDSVTSKIDVSPIITSIRNNIPELTTWKDSTACLIVSGKLIYRNDSLNVTVDKREFNNETVLIKHKGRRKKVKWLFGLRLGGREIKFTPKASCGTSKVTIIEKE